MIILSLVVQNNYNQNSLHTRTLRYKYLAIFKCTQLFWMLYKTTISYFRYRTSNIFLLKSTKWLYNRHLLPTVHNKFSNLHTNELGLLTNQLTFSYMHHTTFSLLTKFNFPLTKSFTTKPTLSDCFSHKDLIYKKPITILSFSIKNFFFKKLLFLVLHILTLSHISFSKHTFNVKQALLLYYKHYQILNFSNIFYFKLRRY